MKAGIKHEGERMNMIGSDESRESFLAVTNRQSYSICYLNVDFAYSILKNASVNLLSRLNIISYGPQNNLKRTHLQIHFDFDN